MPSGLTTTERVLEQLPERIRAQELALDVFRTEPLPKSNIGKILRRVLRLEGALE